MNLGMIWAQDAVRGIGAKGKIPWNIPEDMKFFKNTTLNSTVIMGRNTWNSLPKTFSPLPNRNNLVVTSTPLAEEKVFTFSAPDQALTFAKELDEPVWIIGGAALYEYFLSKATKILITEISIIANCDVFAPELSDKEWEKVTTSSWQESENGYKFRFLEYRPKRGRLL